MANLEGSLHAALPGSGDLIAVLIWLPKLSLEGWLREEGSRKADLAAYQQASCITARRELTSYPSITMQRENTTLQKIAFL